MMAPEWRGAIDWYGASWAGDEMSQTRLGGGDGLRAQPSSCDKELEKRATATTEV